MDVCVGCMCWMYVLDVCVGCMCNGCVMDVFSISAMCFVLYICYLLCVGCMCNGCKWFEIERLSLSLSLRSFAGCLFLFVLVCLSRLSLCFFVSLSLCLFVSLSLCLVSTPPPPRFDRAMNMSADVDCQINKQEGQVRTIYLLLLCLINVLLVLYLFTTSYYETLKRYYSI